MGTQIAGGGSEWLAARSTSGEIEAVGDTAESEIGEVRREEICRSQAGGHKRMGGSFRIERGRVGAKLQIGNETKALNEPGMKRGGAWVAVSITKHAPA